MKLKEAIKKLKEADRKNNYSDREYLDSEIGQILKMKEYDFMPSQVGTAAFISSSCVNSESVVSEVIIERGRHAKT